jgi:cyclase
MKFLTACTVVLLMAIPLLSHGNDGPFEFEFREISPGVWTGVRPDGPRFPVMGNVTFVISNEGVVVFDGGGMPAMSEQVISKVRSLTSKPVTHVVTSHWHGDHNFGVFRFGEEYPDVQFIAHQFTDKVMNSARMTYIDRERGFIENNMEEFHKVVVTGTDSEGKEYSEGQRGYYSRIIEDAELIDAEFNRARVTPPNVTFTETYTIESGERTMELLHLGHGNTAGDIVMWLPEERIVATGDMVVLPSPYAFNVPPRAWANSLKALNELDYAQLVPGHGDIQTDTAYVDLIIESAESIADQRDAMLSRGMSLEEIEKNLDFSAFEQRFTHGDEYIRGFYDSWFEGPFRKAAVKVLSGEPMVKIEPGEHISFDDERWQIEAAEHEIVDYRGSVRSGYAVAERCCRTWTSRMG